MANRKNTFLLKRSNVAGNIPVAGQIELGELALNTADVKLYASGTTTNSILQVGWDRVSRTGDTMTGALYLPTISATTYQNLPLDIRVTGGTYAAGTTTFTNNTGGTFNVAGYYTGFNGGVVSGITATTTSVFNGGLILNGTSLRASPYEFYGEVNLSSTLDGTNNTAYINIGTFSDSFTHIVVEVKLVPWLLNTASIGSYTKVYVIRMTSASPGIVSLYGTQVTEDIGTTGDKYQIGTPIANASNLLQIPVHYIGSGSGNGNPIIAYIRVRGNIVSNLDKVSLSAGTPTVVTGGTQEYTSIRNRLGINTLFPTSNLEVVGTTRLSGDTTISTNAGRLILNQTTAGSVLNGIDFTTYTGGVGGSLLLNQSTGEFRMSTSSSYFPTFYSNGSERMRIFNTGNVAINTNVDSGYKLDVSGTARVSTSTANTGFIVASSVTGNTGNFSITANATAIGSQGDFTLGTASGTRLFIGGNYSTIFTSTNNVTINPSLIVNGNLSVNGGGASNVYSNNLILGSTGNTSGNIFFTTASQESKVLWRLNNLGSFGRTDLFLCINNATTTAPATIADAKVGFLANGNVLINTTTDAGYKFDVNGTTRLSGDTIVNGGFTANTISATTYFNLPSSTFTGGTVTGSTNFTGGLTVNTISATTYQNLPTDVYVTGGTYSSGVATFRNTTGGTFNVNGFFTGGTPSVSFTQSSPATGWTFTHNLGLERPLVTVYNSSNQVIIPQEISAVSTTTLYITFPVPVSGYAIAAGGVVTQQTEEINIITSIIFG